MVKFTRLADLELKLWEGGKYIYVYMWTDAVPKDGTQLWHAKAKIVELDGTERILQFDLPNILVPGTWESLTARFFAGYPEANRLGETMLPEQDQIKAILKKNLGD